MTKEIFLTKWATDCAMVVDLEAVIKREIAKAKEANEIKNNFYFNKQVMNPYETGSQSYTAYEKGFIDGYNKSNEIAKVKEQPQPEPKYPIGGYAPGHYTCICSNCKKEFMGDKRAVQCEPCGVKTTSQPTEQVTDQVTNQVIDQEQPEMTEKEKIDHILTNKLTWKPMGNKRFYANMIGGKSSEGSRQVCFVDYNNPHSGYFETRIFTIDLSEWQPVETEKPSSQGKLDNSFDKDRFEAMFRAVVASGQKLDFEFCKRETTYFIKQLDAYYTEKGGANE